jgi:hypothetical protein
MSDAATRIAALEADAAAARKRVQELIADYHRLLERTDEQRAAYEAHMSVVETDAHEEGRREGLEQAAAWHEAKAERQEADWRSIGLDALGKCPMAQKHREYAATLRAMKDKP